MSTLMDIQRPRTRLPWLTRRRLPVLVAGAAVVIAVAIALATLGDALPSTSRSGVWIDTARQGEMLREIRANGTLVPQDVRWITAGATATVQSVEVLPGAAVEADTVVLRLTNPALQAALEQATAALAGAEADVVAARTQLASQVLDQRSALSSAESELRITQVRHEALTRAHGFGVIADVELRQSQIELEESQSKAELERERVAAFSQNVDAQLQAVRARRDEAASALAIARQDADSLEVAAGIDGILQQVEVEPGQRVDAGASLARVARPDRLLARLQVAEVLANDLVLDLPVTVDTRNGAAEGRVARIDPAVVNGSVVVDVVFADAPPAGARPDLSVEGRILLDRLDDVVSIARPPLAVPGSSSSLFVLAPDDEVARRTPVRYGAASSDRIEVVEGLRPGDRAVLSDTSQWDAYPALRLR